MPETTPSAEIVTIPCRKDNYAYLLHDKATGQTAVIDVPEAAPIAAALEAKGWVLSHVLITHHHYDHVDGLADLLDGRKGVQVLGAAMDAHRLPALDRALSEGESVTIGELTGHVLDVSGHTIGHIAFHFPQARAVFTADSLMALGCGRLFEGTPAQMWESLSKLAKLPPETLVCSGHEYTSANANFAQSIEPDNSELKSRSEMITQHRAQGLPTVPSLLSVELKTNPFLRAHLPEVKAAIGMQDASDVAVFTEIRSRKDHF